MIDPMTQVWLGGLCTGIIVTLISVWYAHWIWTVWKTPPNAPLEDPKQCPDTEMPGH